MKTIQAITILAAAVFAYASTESDECISTACLDFRSLSVSCGYNIDTASSKKSYTQEMCICGDSTYSRVSKECFTCIAQYNLQNYNVTQWGEDCFNAFSQPKPAQSGASAVGVRGGFGLMVAAGVGFLVMTG